MLRLLRSFSLALSALLAAPVGAHAVATVNFEPPGTLTEGHVRLVVSGELSSKGVFLGFVAPSGTQKCPTSMSEAEMTFVGFGSPEGEAAGDFTEGINVWVVRPGAILACAYDESFSDLTESQTEGHAELTADVELAPNTACNEQTLVCVKTTTTQEGSVVTTQVCEETLTAASCTSTHTTTAPKKAVHRAPAQRRPQLVCVDKRGYYVGQIEPRRCLVDRPYASRSETLDLADLHWTSWGPNRATATGEDLGEHPGQPGARPYRVRIVASKVGTNPTTGAPMFTRVTEYSARAPHGYTVTPY